MKYTDNALNIITTKSYKGIGRAWIVKNLIGNESVNEIITLLNNKSKQVETVTVEDFEYKKKHTINQINNLKESCDGIIAIGDNNFPKHRGNVKDSERPIFLFYKGDINLLSINNNNIAVIGLLNPDESIEYREQKIVNEIIKQGVTIVSGLALGCDSIAHKQALTSGLTVAILPSPLNNIMPAKNKGLALEIIKKGGLLITEYSDKHKSAMELSSRYKERDRLQALFCDAIILVASYAQDSAKRWNIFNEKLDSGARLAMRFAKDYSISQAVMYDEKADLNNPMFDLNRQLIDEHKSITILTPKHLENLINMVKNQSTTFQSNLFDK
ncbi:DNA-processing protein DprA [Labilibacter marinus]|uniref:DNA-processing protein DprA n=1 Tax=Labilibacter marinus TaxID=1477105 RepID=UPI00095004BC|nr:DNA-processing protein DprA [Labilibacter marinus]